MIDILQRIVYTVA